MNLWDFSCSFSWVSLMASTTALASSDDGYHHRAVGYSSLVGCPAPLMMMRSATAMKDLRCDREWIQFEVVHRFHCQS